MASRLHAELAAAPCLEHRLVRLAPFLRLPQFVRFLPLRPGPRVCLPSPLGGPLSRAVRAALAARLGSNTEGKAMPSMTVYVAVLALVVVLLVAVWAIWRAL